jgi:hypothetical protein
MNLDEGQRKKVAEWIEQGLKLSEIQSRLVSELGVKMTYMDVRFLVDDLKLVPKDIEPLQPVSSTLSGPANVEPKDGRQTTQPAGPIAKPSDAPAGAVNVSLVVDQLARPGAVVSGKVTFTDGNRADWYIDQTGRLGLVPQQTGYRPPAGDLQQFQSALEAELAKLGF